MVGMLIPHFGKARAIVFAPLPGLITLLVALASVRDLLFCAKDLFVAANDGKGPDHTGIRARPGQVNRAGLSDLFGPSRSVLTGWAEHFLVALPPSWDLFICAKDLFVEAKLAPPQQSNLSRHRAWCFAQY